MTIIGWICIAVAVLFAIRFWILMAEVSDYMAYRIRQIQQREFERTGR